MEPFAAALLHLLALTTLLTTWLVLRIGEASGLLERLFGSQQMVDEAMYSDIYYRPSWLRDLPRMPSPVRVEPSVDRS
jgi:hypothetical protein